MSFCRDICQCLSCKNKKRILYAFDFDRTIIDDNSEDTYKKFLSPDSLHQLTVAQQNLYDWPSMCQAILDCLQNQGVEMSNVLDYIKGIPFVPGMDILLQKIAESSPSNDNDFIIISGANDLFIKTRLESLRPPVIPKYIFANHVRQTDRGRWTYGVFENQTNCRLCASFMCKGGILERYIVEHGDFEEVYYIGDGGNDVCPATRLRPQDTLFVRTGYQLDEFIRIGTYSNTEITISAKIIYFTNYTDIIDNMKIPKKKSCRFF